MSKTTPAAFPIRMVMSWKSSPMVMWRPREIRRTNTKQEMPWNKKESVLIFTIAYYTNFNKGSSRTLQVRKYHMEILTAIRRGIIEVYNTDRCAEI